MHSGVPAHLPPLIADYTGGVFARQSEGIRGPKTKKPTNYGGLSHIDITPEGA